MSEHLKPSNEINGEQQQPSNTESLTPNTEKAEVDATPAEALPEAEQIRSDVEKAEQQSAPSEAIKKSLEASQTEADVPQLASSDHKKLMLARTLNKTQRQLPRRERALSKIVHQPVIDRLSEVSGKTIARPSGLLSGGIFALTGSVVFLYITRHYGYQYNYLLFALLFVGGFFVGLIFELLLSFIRSHRQPR